MSNKQQAGDAPQSVPVKGSATTAEATALAILVERLEQMEYTMRAMQRQMSSMEQAQTTALKQFQQEQIDFKAESAQALEAAKEQLQQLQEAKPQDPATTAMLTNTLQAQAQQKVAQKKALFQEKLRDMPKGQLTNHTEEVLVIGINGINVVLQPGETKKVPIIYIEQYEKNQELAKWAVEQERLLQIDGEDVPAYEMVQNWRSEMTHYDPSVVPTS